MLAGLSLSAVAWLAAAGVLLDALLGEPRRAHPLVAFGRYAQALERRLNHGRLRLAKGAAGWLVAVAPATAAAMLLTWPAAEGSGSRTATATWAVPAIHALLLYFAIGLRSLREHTRPIAAALAAGDLARAREATARIVSRDTRQAGADDLAKAGVESLLENGNDAVFGALFWFAVAGGPGALLFRLANTLDAMWGYRTARLAQYGCAAARMDDLLNLLPARLTACTYAVLGRTVMALRCWRRQAPQWSSPNAGPVMAAGAGALGVTLGGSAIYDGVEEKRPVLGAGPPPVAADIDRAWRLIVKTTVAWLAMLAMLALLALIGTSATSVTSVKSATSATSASSAMQAP